MGHGNFVGMRGEDGCFQLAGALIYPMGKPTHLVGTLRFAHPTNFRWTPDGDCWMVVPLTVGRVAVYRLPYARFPDAKM